MQKQQEMLEQQKKMQEQHRMEKELMENERLEQIKNKKDGEQSELSPPPWPLTSTEHFTVQGHNNRNPSLISQFFHLQENDIFWRHTIFMCLSIENNMTTQFVFSLI